MILDFARGGVGFEPVLIPTGAENGGFEPEK